MWMVAYMAAMFGMMTVGIPFWKWLGERYGKRDTFIVAWLCNIGIVASGG